MSSRREPSRIIYGADDRPERPAMREALALLDLPDGPPPADYSPPTSTFPLTRAARAALRLARGKRR